MKPGNKAIMIHNLNKQFGILRKNTALINVSMEIDEGRCVAIVGHNGAGKTTLLKIVSGIIEKYGGTVKVSSRCGFCPENSVNFDFMKASRNLKYYYQGTNFKEDSENIFNKLKIENSSLHVKDFSKGMKRKLDIARAILSGSNILLLDEPFDGLDPVVSKELSEIIKQLKKEGRTLLISTHQLGNLEDIADEFYFFQKGMILRAMNADEISRIFAIKLKNPEISLETSKKSSYHIMGVSEGKILIRINEGYAENDIIQEIIKDGGRIEYFSRVSLNDLYLAISEGAKFV